MVERAHAAALWSILAGSGRGFHEVRRIGPLGWEEHSIPVADEPFFVDVLTTARADVLVSCIPRREKGNRDRLCDGSMLWAATDSKKSAVKLRGFRPSPALVMGEGDTCRQFAAWWIERPLALDHVERANKRIAHRLWCAKKWSSAEAMFRPAGSLITTGRKRPLEVRELWRDADALYPAARVVKALRDPPAPTWHGREVAA